MDEWLHIILYIHVITYPCFNINASLAYLGKRGHWSPETVIYTKMTRGGGGGGGGLSLHLESSPNEFFVVSYFRRYKHVSSYEIVHVTNGSRFRICDAETTQRLLLVRHHYPQIYYPTKTNFERALPALSNTSWGPSQYKYVVLQV